MRRPLRKEYTFTFKEFALPPFAFTQSESTILCRFRY